MRVEIIDEKGQPLVLPAARVLITSDDGTPASFSMEWGRNTIKTAHAGEPGGKLNDLLRICGVHRVVITNHVTPRPVTEILLP